MAGENSENKAETRKVDHDHADDLLRKSAGFCGGKHYPGP